MPLTKEQKSELEAKMQAFIGQPIGDPDVGRDAVNEPMIRQWCDAMGDTNPAYLDADAAKSTVHGGLVAPPTMLQAWTMHGWEMHEGYDEPRNGQQRLHKLLGDNGYVGVVGTDTQQGYSRYLRPGDVVSSETVVEKISEEKATHLGLGYFITTRTIFKDGEGEEVGWMTFRVLKYTPGDQPAAAPATDEGGAPAPPGRIRPPRGHDNSWWWDLVDEGKFPIQQCNECKELHHPPRPMCHKCRSMDMGWIEASGKGTVYSFTVNVHYPSDSSYIMEIC
jgi:acyl dehydratase